LGSGQRVSKDSIRVQAYGSVDELNSAVGVARSFIDDEELNDVLCRVQENLFVLGSDLAAPGEASLRIPRVNEEMVRFLEQMIDKFDAQLRPLSAFILPTGDRAAALLHLARAVCRRAERKLVALSKAELIGSEIVPYVNRLSDLLFVMGRVVNARRGVAETQWQSKTR
jgi:cob(I)alamin adenosyltransferase